MEVCALLSALLVRNAQRKLRLMLQLKIKTITFGLIHKSNVIMEHQDLLLVLLAKGPSRCMITVLSSLLSITALTPHLQKS